MLKFSTVTDTTGMLGLSVGKDAEIAGRVVLNVGLLADTSGALDGGARIDAGELSGMVIPLRVAQTLMSSSYNECQY